MKICGIVRPGEATDAIDAGADAIGLNFVRASRRCIDLETARTILKVVPPRVMTVGIFQDHSAEEVLEVTGALGLGAAQLHGDESPDVTAAVAVGVETVIKVFAAGSQSVRSISEHAADIVMLDAPIPGGGVVFDWTLVGDLVAKHKILLAGGRRPATRQRRRGDPSLATVGSRCRLWGRNGTGAQRPGRDGSLRDRSARCHKNRTPVVSVGEGRERFCEQVVRPFPQLRAGTAVVAHRSSPRMRAG